MQAIQAERRDSVETVSAIVEYMDARGITQSNLARKAGIKIPALCLALNGRRKLTLEEYAAICFVLGVNTDYFLKPKLPEKTKNC